jgi:hypothetical protein
VERVLNQQKEINMGEKEMKEIIEYAQKQIDRYTKIIEHWEKIRDDLEDIVADSSFHE